jgi:hypothetical protein
MKHPVGSLLRVAGSNTLYAHDSSGGDENYLLIGARAWVTIYNRAIVCREPFLLLAVYRNDNGQLVCIDLLLFNGKFVTVECTELPAAWLAQAFELVS